MTLRDEARGRERGASRCDANASELAREALKTDLVERSAARLRRVAATRAAYPPHWLDKPELASLRVLSERVFCDSCAIAATVNSVDGEPYFVARYFVCVAGGLRGAAGFEGIDRPNWSARPDLPLYAQANGRFFAGGRVREDLSDITHVRLRWADGEELVEHVENGVVLFSGRRDRLGPATMDLIDGDGHARRQHSVFGQPGD